MDPILLQAVRLLDKIFEDVYLMVITAISAAGLRFIFQHFYQTAVDSTQPGFSEAGIKCCVGSLAQR